MGLFGKKPTIFDEQQDKALKALVKNQAILIKNNDYFVKTDKDKWAWINKLESDNKTLLNRVATLESQIVAMQQIDADFKAKFAAFAQTTTEE